MKEENFETTEKQLLKLKSLKPNSEWTAGLSAIISSRFEERPLSQRKFHWGFRLAIVASFVVILFLSTAYFSAQALPGDSFYPLKRSYEDLALRSREKNRVSLEQSLSSKRIEELKKTAAVKDTAVKAALNEVKKSVSKVSDEVAIAKATTDPEMKETLKDLPSSIEENQRQLTSLQASLTADDQKEVVSILNSLEKLKVQLRLESSEEDTPDPTDPEK